MMKARTSLWASLAIAASLGLAGCGGSSDNDGDGGTPPATPSGPTTHDPITVPAAADLRVNADGSGTSNIKAGESRKAPGGGILACATADCALAIVRDAGDGSFTVTSTGGTVTYTPEADPEVSGAGAIALRGQLLDAGANDTGAEQSGLQNSHLPEGTSPTVTRPQALRKYVGFPGQTDGDAPLTISELADPDKFKAADAPVALQGWKGERWTKDGETIVRYTDQNVETKTDGTFASQFGDKEAGGGNTITNDGDDAQLDWKHAESDSFPTANEQQSYAGDASFAGKFAEVDGKFSCVDSCSLQRDKDGKLSDTGDGGNNWKFTADDENAAVEYKVPDTDYLAFGWWSKSSAGGTTIENFKVLHSGKTAYQTPNTVTGKATFNGHAAGNYVKGSEGGEFVADAKLEATFGEDDGDEVTGTISNFRDSSDESLGKWEVIAKAPTGDAITGGGTFNITDDPTGGAGGKNWTHGQMAGTFYGVDDDTDGTTNNTKQPTGVAGWFHATTRNPATDDGNDFTVTNAWADDDVVVAGAFAATRHNRPDVAAE